MSFDITVIAEILDNVRKATGKKIILTPKDSLPLPASLVEERSSKQIRVEYSPSRCSTGDLAFELLRSSFLNQESMKQLIIYPNENASKDNKKAASWINLLLSLNWALRELQQKGLTASSLLDQLKVNIAYLQDGDEAYDHIHNQHYHKVYAAIMYTIYMLTKNMLHDDVRSTFEDFYKKYDPESRKIGLEVATLLQSKQDETNAIGGKKTLNRLLSMFKLSNLIAHK